MTSFDTHLNKAREGAVFTTEEMAEAIHALMKGDASTDQTALFLLSLARRGETADEIAGAAKTLRSLASTIKSPEGAIDCCGTGGDGANTYNISTAVALAAAGCGVPVAKHGNRSASSKSGAADVLEKLGVTLDLPHDKLEQALNTLNFCFLMAPNHHKAMKSVAEARKGLGMRSIFNLLGPLANPANTKKQLIGVYDAKWLCPMAEALKSLGSEKAMIVHGQDGLDEITLCANTSAVILEKGEISERILTPADFGLGFIMPDFIRGGDVEKNADALQSLLEGKKSAYRDVVLANTAAVLWIHDGRDFKQGVKDAEEAIDSGKALDILEKYKTIKP
ncbi:MAG: anthranilate phosphoribosyltransferase [Micavibrio aeruginosavorus]|uniref:Anthranilate phosphoribosyltransferase n=1 Tax=Micavibrio aeruginosavorus TaxID=349221 RepID=A0A2W5MV14_9BACT|nr:MAG: anthranilate phosphoribosyltransferase [Micavibrio aeruginosavorus]